MGALRRVSGGGLRVLWHRDCQDQGSSKGFLQESDSGFGVWGSWARL